MVLLKQLLEARYDSNEIFAYVLDGEPGEEYANISKIPSDHHYVEWVQETKPLTWDEAEAWVRRGTEDEECLQTWKEFRSRLQSTADSIRGYGDEKLVIVVGLN